MITMLNQFLDGAPDGLLVEVLPAAGGRDPFTATLVGADQAGIVLQLKKNVGFYPWSAVLRLFVTNEDALRAGKAAQSKS